MPVQHLCCTCNIYPISFGQVASVAWYHLWPRMQAGRLLAAIGSICCVSRVWSSSPIMRLRQATQQTRYLDLTLLWCWASVCDAGPTSQQHWINVPCLVVSCHLCPDYVSLHIITCAGQPNSPTERWPLPQSRIGPIIFILYDIYCNTRLLCVGSMLDHRLRQWDNHKPIYIHCHM